MLWRRQLKRCLACGLITALGLAAVYTALDSLSPGFGYRQAGSGVHESDPQRQQMLKLEQRRSGPELLPAVVVVGSQQHQPISSGTSNGTSSRTSGSPANAGSSNSSSSGLHLIPAVLHQTWITDSIPSTYVPFVKSWAAHRPPLAYYYWTDASSLKFVARHYPDLFDMFRGYKTHLNRADAIRYMLLHHYGGIYADMDVQRLRDLTPLLNSSKELCYLSQERYEITRLYWGLNSTVMNAIMLSSPGHKFMEFVVKALPRYAHHSPNVMESTGPFFLQNVLNEFLRSPPCSLREPTCRCAIADPYAFMPQVDPIRIPLFRGKCANHRGLKLNQREACDMLQRLGWRNDLKFVGASSYTHHGFLHYGFENQRLQFPSVANIDAVRSGKLVFGQDFA